MRSSTRCSTSTPTSAGRCVTAFDRGYLDVPYCLHPDNAGRTRSYHRRRRPAAVVRGPARCRSAARAPAPQPPDLTAGRLLAALSYVERRSTTPPSPSRSATRAVPDDHDTSTDSRAMPMTQLSTAPATRAARRPAPREHLTSPVTRAVLRIQHADAAPRPGSSCAEQGFVELLPPIIGPVTDPGARGAKQVDVDYYGHRYKLMTSAILYKQASLLAFDKIFFIAPNVRLEPLETVVDQPAPGRVPPDRRGVRRRLPRRCDARWPRGWCGHVGAPGRRPTAGRAASCSAATPRRSPRSSTGRSSRMTHAERSPRCTRSATRRTRTPRSTGRARQLLSRRRRRAVLHHRLPQGLPRVLRPGEPRAARRCCATST